MTPEKIADKIVNTLFANGHGGEADRLLLIQYGPGWSRGMARAAILKIMRRKPKVPRG